MAQENINIAQPNFCIAPVVGTFATVDTTTTTARLIVKNTGGGTTVSYTFNPNIAQNTNIYYLDYIGPRNLSATTSGMVFITMESNLTSSVTIKKWNLNTANSRLDLDYTITKNSVGYDTIASSAMAVARYYTTFKNTTVTGTGFVDVNDTTNLTVGAKLYLGPSTNTSYLGKYEEVTITTISGNSIFISSAVGKPPFSYYNSGDPITCMGNFYLFSNVGYGANDKKGAFLTLDNKTGAILGRHDSALYANIATANYGVPYSNTVAIVKNSELLYVDVNDYSIVRSCRLNVTRPANTTTLSVKAIALTSASVYRLQQSKIVRLDTGDYSEITWTTYNYQEDGVSRYPDCITLFSPTRVIANQETITIEVYVTDQYGMGVSNKTVTFNKVYGDSIGTWGNVNRQAVTDINGFGTITYTSGFYNSTTISIVNEEIKISAITDGSNVLTGSAYIYTYMTLNLNAKFVLDRSDLAGIGVPLITQKIDSKATTNTVKQLVSFISKFTLRCLSKYIFPGGNEGFFLGSTSVVLVKQLQNFKATMGFVQRKLLTSSGYTKQVAICSGSHPVSQTYISRHLPAGSNKDTVTIAQFRFLIDAIPVPFSYKNNVNTTIWLKLAPSGYSLNRSTLLFKVREVSYEKDTGFITYSNTPRVVVTEFNAGGGLLGLEVLYTPAEYFHNNAVVYVYLEVYDIAIPPNRIEFDYWFIVIPDYKAPYITNENPSRDDTGVALTDDIVFDIIDNEVGVDISTLEFYINNRAKAISYVPITKGYRVTYTNEGIFYFDQTIEISTVIKDSSDQHNVLYDMWRFTTINSIPPFIDAESFTPDTCSRGQNTRTTHIGLNIYDEGTGIDTESIELFVDGHSKEFSLVPIIKRIQ